jgi:aspartyl-tRNA(Asn)/glutamyl-tRNA(Gln) amidotransferase subunit A
MSELTRRRFMAMAAGSYVLHGLSRTTPVQASKIKTAAEGSTADDLTSLTLTEASSKIRARTVTPSQLTQAMLERIAVYNPKVNAYITVMREESLLQAAELDGEQKAGKFRSPLHGLPIALKDNIDTAGVRTTAASGVFEYRVPKEDAEVVRRLKAAGAVLIAKANLGEFATSAPGDVSYFGPTRNPWALDHNTGGSSAGSGSSVAANLCLAAIGTDTGGSIRIPSSWCGIVGFKPTYGLVSIRGIAPLSVSLDHCGPMARRVEDVALVLNEIAGYDRLDIASVDHGKEDYSAAMRQPVSGFRLGTPAQYFDHLDPEVAKAVQEAIAVLTKLTKGVTASTSLPSVEPGAVAPLSLGAPSNAETYAWHEDLYKAYPNRYMPNFRQSLAGRANVLAADYIRALWSLELLRRTIDDSFSEVDLMVLPTMRMTAPIINESLAREAGLVKNSVFDRSRDYTANTTDFDTFGIPALSVPCGFSSTGLPIGLTIAGPHFSEGKILALAHAFQEETQWHSRRAPLSPDMAVPPISVP